MTKITPPRPVRTALLLAAAALLLFSLVPQAMADGGGGEGSSVKSGTHHGKHGSAHRYRVHVGIGYPGYYGFGPYGYGYGRYGYYGHYGYDPYGYGYGYGYSYRRRAATMGALDLNVKPKNTQVWVNGGYVGTTGKLDGSPSMLWLEKDSYEVIFFNEGYETVVRRYTVTPGGVIKEGFLMQPGTSTRPEALSTAAPMPSPEVQDRPKFKEKRRIIERRVERQMERPEPSAGRGHTLDVRQEPGKVAVHVTPGDASIYLDGEFIGTAKDLRRNPVLLVDPGAHRLEIVHPAYESKGVEVTVEAGKKQEIEVSLVKKERGDV